MDLHSLPDSERKGNTKDNLDEIRNAVKYVNKIVSDLQHYAKPLKPKVDMVDIERTVNDVLSSIDNSLTGVRSDVHIEFIVGEGFPKLKLDESYLRRILQNLATNALQAMPNGGKLAISAIHFDGRALIVVEDTGEGIPLDVRDKLFMPLVTTKSKGQGFGLAVVKRFTEGLGGTVTFESEVGKGTKFIVDLPINMN